MKNQRQISASEFKKHFLQLVNEVNSRNIAFTITKRKVPIALVVPLRKESKNQDSYFGYMKGTIKIKGDIINYSSEDDWEINNEQ